jgi:hypothetical protein
MLQLDTDDNYLLDLKSKDVASSSSKSRPASAAADTAGIVGLVFEPGQQVLAAATAGGQVCLFKHWLSKVHAAAAASAAAADPASQWEPSHSFQVSFQALAAAGRVACWGMLCRRLLPGWGLGSVMRPEAVNVL